MVEKNKKQFALIKIVQKKNNIIKAALGRFYYLVA